MNYQKGIIGLFLCINVTCNQAVWSQYKQQNIFPSDSGYVLLQKLVTAYKPALVLDYASARVKMYTEIYNRKDTVECVYTKHALYLDPLYPDPIGYLSKNGNDNGINCEHSFPQSKGADNGNARSDMHHLFPSRAAVNEARSNYPFGEIDDTRTNRWFYKSITQSFIPGALKNEYSESISGLFEPREDHKGNVARAIFYFFSMYELQADVSFFESMKPTLCTWHLQDPVDSLEWERNHLIAKYQDQKPNPFVLDCSLAKRCYCFKNQECQPLVNTNSAHLNELITYPNPVDQILFIENLDFKHPLLVQFFDISGHMQFEYSVKDSFKSKIEIPVSNLPSGFYTVLLRSSNLAQKRIALLKK